jgi:predicted permease
MLETLILDVRFALRLLRRSPLFTTTAVLSLAIGIGALSTIVAVTNALLLRPPAGVTAADRIVDVSGGRGSDEFDSASYPNFLSVRERATTLAGVYAYTAEPHAMSLGGATEAERVYGALVSTNYFSVLGTRPQAGRLFEAGDDRGAGAHAVAVIGDELWERRFGRDPAIAGRQILVNGTAFTVVGVAPRGFQGTTVLRPQLWVPTAMVSQAIPRRSAAILASRGATWIFMGGRLRDGVTLAQANAELEAISASLQREYPGDNEGLRVRALPSSLMPGMAGPITAFLAMLMVIVGLLLLVACANLAGMLLARGAARTREVAMRVTLGAGRGRLVRQLLTETLVLFAIGSIAGLVLSTWLTRLLLAVVPELPVPIGLDVVVDWRVMAITLSVAFVAAVLSGLAPSLQSARGDLLPALKSAAAAVGPTRLRLRNVFVVGQVTISLVLVVSAGLFLRAMHHAATIPIGFEPRDVNVVSFDLSLAGYRGEPGERFLTDLLDRVRQVPGVRAAAATVDLPLDGSRMGLGPITIPGVTRQDGNTRLSADWNVATPGLYATLGIPILKGRDFSHSDTAGAPRVAIVNEAFVRAFLGDRDPIGTTFQMFDQEDARVPVTIVGVSADARLMSFGDAAEPYVTVPRAQRDMAGLSLVVKTSGTSVIPDVRRIIREMNPNLPVNEALALEQVTAIGLLPQRIAAAVAGSLGAVGLLLAAIGIYGVTAYAVARRTREIGIRVALGADAHRLTWLLLRQGATLAAIGVTAGVAVAAVGSRFIGSLLYGIPPLDPLTFGGAAVLFAIVTLAATYVPTRRALKLDPMVALRND